MRWQLQRGAIGVVGIVLVVACSAGSTSQGSGAAAEPSSARADRDGYAAALAHARAARRAQLHAPDGWLSYTGSGRVRPGRYRVGADPHADIVLPAGPAQLGNLTLDPEGQLRFQAAAGTAVTLHGKPVTEVVLAPERAGQPGDRLRIDAREFYVVQTGALYGWRFRDPAALAQFGELDYFPTDAHWRIDAQWQPYDAPRATTLLTSIGTPLTVQVPGEAAFTATANAIACVRSYRMAMRGCSSCSPTAPAARKATAVRAISTQTRRATAALCWISIWPRTRRAR